VAPFRRHPEFVSVAVTTRALKVYRVARAFPTNWFTKKNDPQRLDAGAVGPGMRDGPRKKGGRRGDFWRPEGPPAIVCCETFGTAQEF
jgi:hypothetical protein